MNYGIAASKAILQVVVVLVLFLLVVYMAGCNLNQVPKDPPPSMRPPTVHMEVVDGQRYLIVRNHTNKKMTVSVVCDDVPEDQVIYGIPLEPWGSTSYFWQKDNSCVLNNYRILED